MHDPGAPRTVSQRFRGAIDNLLELDVLQREALSNHWVPKARRKSAPSLLPPLRSDDQHPAAPHDLSTATSTAAAGSIEALAVAAALKAMAADSSSDESDVLRWVHRAGRQEKMRPILMASSSSSDDDDDDDEGEARGRLRGGSGRRERKVAYERAIASVMRPSGGHDDMLLANKTLHHNWKGTGSAATEMGSGGMGGASRRTSAMVLAEEAEALILAAEQGEDTRPGIATTSTVVKKGPLVTVGGRGWGDPVLPDEGSTALKPSKPLVLSSGLDGNRVAQGSQQQSLSLDAAAAPRVGGVTAMTTSITTEERLAPVLEQLCRLMQSLQSHLGGSALSSSASPTSQPAFIYPRPAPKPPTDLMASFMELDSVPRMAVSMHSIDGTAACMPLDCPPNQSSVPSSATGRNQEHLALSERPFGRVSRKDLSALAAVTALDHLLEEALSSLGGSTPPTGSSSVHCGSSSQSSSGGSGTGCVTKLV